MIHCIANCVDCSWTAENYKNAQVIAAKHAKKYGHKVLVEYAISGYYDGRNENENQT